MGEPETPGGDDGVGPKVAVVLIALTAVVMLPRWIYRAARPAKTQVLQQGFGTSDAEEAPAQPGRPARGNAIPASRAPALRQAIAAPRSLEPTPDAPSAAAGRQFPIPKDEPAPRAAVPRGSFEQLAGLPQGSSSAADDGGPMTPQRAASRALAEELRRAVPGAAAAKPRRSGSGYSSRPAQTPYSGSAFAPGDARTSEGAPVRASGKASAPAPRTGPAPQTPAEKGAQTARPSGAPDAKGAGAAGSGGGGGGGGGASAGGGGGGGSGSQKDEKKKDDKKKPGQQNQPAGEDEKKKDADKKRDDERDSARPPGDPNAPPKEALDSVGASLKAMDGSLAELGANAEKVAAAGGALADGDEWQRKLADPVSQAADVAGGWANTGGAALQNFSQAHEALSEAKADLEEAGTFLDKGLGTLEKRAGTAIAEGTPPPPSPETETALSKAESKLLTADGRTAAAEDSIGAGELIAFPPGRAEDYRPSIVAHRSAATDLVTDLAARHPEMTGPRSQPRTTLAGMATTEKKLAAAVARTDAAANTLRAASTSVGRARQELVSVLDEARTVREELDGLRDQPLPDPDAQAAKIAELKARLAQARAQMNAALKPTKP